MDNRRVEKHHLVYCGQTASTRYSRGPSECGETRDLQRRRAADKCAPTV